jgi:hypothetical protein
MMNWTTPPYLLDGQASVRRVMLQVLVGLLPGIAAYVWLVGPSILLQLALATISALAGEALMLRLRGKPLSLFLERWQRDRDRLADRADLSAACAVVVGRRRHAVSPSSLPSTSTADSARILSTRRWSPSPRASSPFRP